MNGPVVVAGASGFVGSHLVERLTLAPVILFHCLPGILIGAWMQNRARARLEAKSAA